MHCCRDVRNDVGSGQAAFSSKTRNAGIPIWLGSGCLLTVEFPVPLASFPDFGAQLPDNHV